MTSRLLRPRERWPISIVLVALLVGLSLRLVPCLRDPRFDFVVDAGYHERLTREAVARGRLPAVDSLSQAPQGRRTADELPLGLVTLGSIGHSLLARVGSRDLHWNLALLVALAGALIAVPVYIGARALAVPAALAACAALLSEFLPAHLQRSEGFYWRFDAFGTLFAASHAALALAAVAAQRPPRRWILAIVSAGMLVLALAFWRVSLILLALELAGSLVFVALRGSTPGLRDLWNAVAWAGGLGLVPIGYLWRHEFLLSPLWILTAGFAISLILPVLRPERPVRNRVIWLVLLLGAAAFVGRSGFSRDYGGVLSMLPARLGFERGYDPTTALMLDIQELHATSWTQLLFGPRHFSWLGLWLVASPLLVWWRRGRPSLARMLPVDAAPALLSFVTAGLVALTLAFERTSVLLAPFLSMSLGVLATQLAATPASGALPGTQGKSARQPPATRRSRGRSPGAGRTAASVLASLLALSALVTIFAGIREAFTSWARLPAAERLALNYLRDHAPRGAVVLSLWDAGYDLQNQTGLRTVVDGLLEDAENRRRIIELDRAFMETTPTALDTICRRFDATWLLIPPPTWVGGIAVATHDPIAPILERGEPLAPGPQTDHVILHLMLGDRAFPEFREVFEAGGYRVFQVAARPRPIGT
jgi:hypothetical protein